MQPAADSSKGNIDGMGGRRAQERVVTDVRVGNVLLADKSVSGDVIGGEEGRDAHSSASLGGHPLSPLLAPHLSSSKPRDLAFKVDSNTLVPLSICRYGYGTIWRESEKRLFYIQSELETHGRHAPVSQVNTCHARLVLPQ